jgi:hypothetical protein
MCPNRYDLMLGKNVIYWNQIIRASERSGIIPQSIAAVISAEAAKYPVESGSQHQYVKIQQTRQRTLLYIRVQLQV